MRGESEPRPVGVRLDRGEQPTRDDPGEEGEGNLERQTDQEHRRRDEHRHAFPVRDPLDVLLSDEGRDADQREDPRRRRVASRPEARKRQS